LEAPPKQPRRADFFFLGMILCFCLHFLPISPPQRRFWSEKNAVQQISSRLSIGFQGSQPTRAHQSPLEPQRGVYQSPPKLSRAYQNPKKEGFTNEAHQIPPEPQRGVYQSPPKLTKANQNSKKGGFTNEAHQSSPEPQRGVYQSPPKVVGAYQNPKKEGLPTKCHKTSTKNPRWFSPFEAHKTPNSDRNIGQSPSLSEEPKSKDSALAAFPDRELSRDAS
jgi:hypothetical protein